VEVLSEAVIAGGDPAKIFEASKHSLDGVAVSVGYGEKQFFQMRLDFGGMFGAAPFASIFRRTAFES